MTVFIIYSVKRGFRANWYGAHGFTKDGINYKYNHYSKVIFLGCDAPKNIDLTIKPERRTDKFFKWLGVSEEFQMGNRDLDEEIYFATDNKILIDIIKGSKKLQENFLKIIRLSENYDVKLKHLHCYDEKIWLQFHQLKFFKKHDHSVEELAEKFIPILKNIADELRDKIIISNNAKDPFSIKAAAILSVSTGFALYSIYIFIAHHFVGYYQLIETKSLITNAVLIGLGMVILMSIITIRVLGKTSRAHLVLIEIIIVGFLSFSAGAGFLIRDINIDYDSSRSHFVNTIIHNKRITHFRKGGIKYSVSVNYDSNKLTIKVPSSFYSQVKIGDNLCIEVKEGLLNYEWMKNLYNKPCYLIQKF